MEDNNLKIEQNQNEKIDFEAEVNENIKIANLVYSMPKDIKNEIAKLLDKKEEIMKKNGIFALYKIDHINKKIEKLKEKAKKQNENIPNNNNLNNNIKTDNE